MRPPPAHPPRRARYNYFGASNETETLAVADFMAEHLTRFGYDTLTLDEGWAYDNGKLLIDANGIPRANAAMYPRGLPWLASQLAGRGLKLGLWVIRGVPREAYAADAPIAPP